MCSPFLRNVRTHLSGQKSKGKAAPLQAWRILIISTVQYTKVTDDQQKKKMEWQVTRIGTVKNALKILFGKIERKRYFGKRRLRREDNIKMHFKEVGLESVD